MLVNGQWQGDWSPSNKEDEGRFIRKPSAFRNWITEDGAAGPTGGAGFKAEAGRYHLYVALICPWASRALMARSLLGLESVISVSVLNPRLSAQGWQFSGFAGADEDAINQAQYLHQIYTMANPSYSGRATVPVLWDKKLNTIVNNESADILRMLGSAFKSLGLKGPNLYPQALQSEIEAINTEIYDGLNNGVYRAGFADTQEAYEEAYADVFATLDKLEQRLSDGRSFLLGDAMTESDIRLFVSLVRFDAAYHGLFKCNRNTLKSMSNLYRYAKRIYQIEGLANTVNFEHIKQGYYSIKKLNPNGIVPVGPENF